MQVGALLAGFILCLVFWIPAHRLASGRTDLIVSSFFFILAFATLLPLCYLRAIKALIVALEHEKARQNGEKCADSQPENPADGRTALVLEK
jgi:hypothetical protein